MHQFPLPVLLLMSVALAVSVKKRVYTGCGAEMTDVLDGFIDYPGEGRNYPNNAKCVWKITIREGKRFQVSFLRFATDNHKDILLVKNGQSGTSIGQFFGKNYNPAEFETAGNELWLQFSSDARDTNKGFQLTWNTIDTKGDIEERLQNLEVEHQSINHNQNSTHSKLDFIIEHLDDTTPAPPTCPIVTCPPVDKYGNIEERIQNMEVELQSINHNLNSTHSKLDFLIEHLDEKWSELRNACIKGNNYKVFNGLTIDECKGKCVNEDGINCQSIDYHSQSQTCHISEARSDSGNYTEPCYVAGFQFTELLIYDDEE